MTIGLFDATPPTASTASWVVLLSFGLAAQANFDIYLGSFALSGNPSQEKRFIFDQDPTCNDPATTDVSGSKTGVCCGGGGCWGGSDPTGIDELEMHFTNNPLFHWTIYRDRGSYDMIGLDGKVYGNCDPFPSVDFFCGGAFSSYTGNRKMRCYTQVSAAEISAGR
ncbi:hypothetical protein C8A05DRAFT_38144 [Staphylotrichum tortipilum]|uniref:Uncharacterized protein n=1 Tax=Staphylotrichum tortipilum TaxID=2831512 RepID=A0AAN6MD55_9PEZI|nr:hypothetical protein C8A05DRAFT_38144 [Staphylotrichum longicolle]